MFFKSVIAVIEVYKGVPIYEYENIDNVTFVILKNGLHFDIMEFPNLNECEKFIDM